MNEQTITLFDLSDIGGNGYLRLSDLHDFERSGLTLKKVTNTNATNDELVDFLSKYRIHAREDVPVDLGRKLTTHIAKKALYIDAKPNEALKVLEAIIILIVRSEGINVNTAYAVWRGHRETYRSVATLVNVNRQVNNRVKKAKKQYTNWWLEENRG